MKFLHRTFHFVTTISRKSRADYVSAHSGHSALFLIISVFPLLILMLALIKHTGLGENELLALLQGLAPKAFQGIIADSVSQIFGRIGRLAVSLTVVTLLWSASGFIYSITLALNRIYKYEENRNYFLLRGISLLYTLLFLILLLIIISLSVLVQRLWGYVLLHSNCDFVSFLLNLIPKLLSFLLLLFVVSMFYSFIPKTKSKILSHLPGSLMATVSWYVFSLVYPIYLRYFSNISYIYGGLAIAILWLWWLYFSIYIFYLGAEVNAQLITLREMRKTNE